MINGRKLLSDWLKWHGMASKAPTTEPVALLEQTRAALGGYFDADNWIKVDAGLPTNAEPVWVFVARGQYERSNVKEAPDLRIGIGSCVWARDGKRTWESDFISVTITHWQPIIPPSGCSL